MKEDEAKKERPVEAEETKEDEKPAEPAKDEESVVESLEKELEEEEAIEGEEKAKAEEKTGAEEDEAAPEAEAEEKEAKKPKREKKEEKEEEIVEERTYTIPLSKAWIMPANKRAPKAMRILKGFLVKHMKLKAKAPVEGEEEEEPGALIISNEVNQRLWSRGIEKPPRNIRVRAAKDKDGNVTVYLAEGD
jgi:large subunit ribosomal protein L31e